MDQWLIMWGPHTVGLLFAAMMGASVGSFVQVVGERMPVGMSVIRPPSRCVHCGRRLAWHENLPVLGWLLCRGRCWSCGGGIPRRYALFEAMLGALFALVYLQLFVLDYGGTWRAYGGAFFQANGFMASLPAVVALLVLLGALAAATLTDIRSASIPVVVTLVPTLVALVAWPIEALVADPASLRSWPMTLPGRAGCAAAIGGAAGLCFSLAMVTSGRWRRSFSDYGAFVKDGETFADYPHARREMWREIVYLAPIAAGGVLGWLAGRSTAGAVPMPVQALAASLLGYFAGAGLAWAVRIAGSLWRGQEALGLGDVHLLGAIGAVMGWVDPVVAFVVAPFPTLAWVAASSIRARWSGGRAKGREIPYGPWLVLAWLLLLLLRPWFESAGRWLFPLFFS